jgi:hypothetical protein
MGDFPCINENRGPAQTVTVAVHVCGIDDGYGPVTIGAPFDTTVTCDAVRLDELIDALQALRRRIGNNIGQPTPA